MHLVGGLSVGRRPRLHGPRPPAGGRRSLAAGVARAVPVFSILAVGSVVTLIAAGSLRGYQEVRAFHGLWDTTYGLLLLVKIGLVLPLLALGAYNNRFAVPRLKRQIASVLEQRRFLRAAGASSDHGSDRRRDRGARHGAAGEGVRQGAEVHLGHRPDREPRSELHDRACEGRAEHHPPLLLHPEGEPANVDDAKLSATLPSADVGLFASRWRIVPSHYTTPAGVFPQPGEWQVTLEARRGEFEALTQTVTVPIREG